MKGRNGPETVMEILDLLRDDMFVQGKTPTGSRPPSLRDACYAYVLSVRNNDYDGDPKIIESFVNGLELGALDALLAAWRKAQCLS